MGSICRRKYSAKVDPAEPAEVEWFRRVTQAIPDAPIGKRSAIAARLTLLHLQPQPSNTFTKVVGSVWP